LYGIWDRAPDSLDTGYNGVRIDVGASVPKTATLSNWPETDALGNETHTLLRQTVLTEGALDTDGDGVADSSEYYRVISNNLGNWAFDKTNALPATHRFYNKDINEDGSINDEDLIPTANVGWVFDLPGIFDLLGDGVDNDKDGSTDESGERILGERVVNDTLIRDGRSIMVSFGVTGTRCNAGAYSFLNERDANTGGMTAYSIYDLNGDGEIDADDGVELQVNYDVDGDGDVDADDVITAYPSDIAFEGRLFNPAILEKSDDVEEKILGNSQRKMIPLDERKERRGFSYWQQVE
jgi:hypothetical protein